MDNQNNRELHRIYGGKVCVAFYPASHRYKVEGTSGFAIGVTSVTGMKDKSGVLMWWATNLAKDFLLGRIAARQPITEADVTEACGLHRVRKEEAADIGKEIHGWIEAWTKGQNPPIPEGDDKENVRNGIMAFLKWATDHKVKILEPERIVYSMKHGYIGTLDAIGEIEGDKVLIDYKSGKGVYTEFLYQTAAYQEAYQEETGTRVKGRWLISLGKDDGEFKAVYIPNDGFEPDLKAFLGLLALKKREIELAEWSKSVNGK